MCRKIAAYITLALLLPVLNAPDVWGQGAILRDEQRQLSLPVNERLPEELQSKGLVYRGFNYLAQLKVGARYDSNILAQSSGEKSDTIFSVQPKLNVVKKLDAHTISFGGQADIERFASRSDENKEDFLLFTRGQFVANNKWSFPVFSTYQKKARNRGSLAVSISEKPLDINYFNAGAGVTRSFNRLSIGLTGEYKNIKFEDGQILSSTNPAIFSDNDRNEYHAKLTARYEFPRDASGSKPEHILFADFIYGMQDYKRGDFVGGSFSGSSGDRSEYGFLAGFETSYKGLLFANIGAGLIRQSFDENSFDDISQFDLNADIAYNITPKLTLNFAAERDINQDNGFVQGVVETGYTLGADYELLHNLYLNGEAGYSTYDFEGISREDEDISALFALRYINSHRLETNLEARFQSRDSTISTNEFDRAVFLISMIGKL